MVTLWLLVSCANGVLDMAGLFSESSTEGLNGILTPATGVADGAAPSPQCPLLPASGRTLKLAGMVGGRTGNAMFAYASLRGLSKYYNTDPGGVQTTCPGVDDGVFAGFVSSHFANSGDFESSKSFWTNNMVNTGRFDSHVLDLQKPTFLDNYLQTWKYFCNIEPELLEELMTLFLTCFKGATVSHTPTVTLAVVHA